MDRVDYWNRFFKMDSVQNGLVVIGEDLNFTLRAPEVWGSIAQLDPLSGYFITKLEKTGFLDIEPSKLSPT
jgi:hypothetical protein